MNLATSICRNGGRVVAGTRAAGAPAPTSSPGHPSGGPGISPGPNPPRAGGREMKTYTPSTPPKRDSRPGGRSAPARRGRVPIDTEARFYHPARLASLGDLPPPAREARQGEVGRVVSLSLSAAILDLVPERPACPT